MSNPVGESTPAVDGAPAVLCADDYAAIAAAMRRIRDDEAAARATADRGLVTLCGMVHTNDTPWTIAWSDVNDPEVWR